ncbi:hypothetical protein ACH4TX_11650 [Streptomyces sp. NPDC021098]|uniref:hypothetical protein n=1 Tax=unclassified Streptomyces TaxID=2593676 RepID=UPI0037B96DAC
MPLTAAFQGLTALALSGAFSTEQIEEGLAETTAVLALVSSLVMSYLLSGQRLPENHLADRPGYAEYTARASGFFPLPPRRDAREGRTGR